MTLRYRRIDFKTKYWRNNGSFSTSKKVILSQNASSKTSLMNKIIVFILISFTLFLAKGINSYSQEPPPPLAQVKIEKKADSAKPDISGKTDAKPPQNRMPIVVNKVHTTSNEKHRQHTETKENKKRSESLFSGLLVLFTGCLVICNILLWIATKKSADAAKESVELVQKAFIATHRPKLRVHSIYLKKINPPPEKVVNGSYITYRLNYSIDNIGGSHTTITKESLTFKRLNQPLPIPLYAVPLLIKKTIACGESIIESFNVEESLICSNKERGLNDLYFFGHIDYLDNIGTTRRTAFCRRYSRETKRFVKVEDEDYEYGY